MTQLLTPAQAVEVIGCDRSTLFRWQQLGRIRPAMKVPGETGAYLYDRTEVERVAAEYRSTQDGAA